VLIITITNYFPEYNTIAYHQDAEQWKTSIISCK